MSMIKYRNENKLDSKKDRLFGGQRRRRHSLQPLPYSARLMTGTPCCWAYLTVYAVPPVASLR